MDLEDLAAGRDVSIHISLWRADLLCGVVEVDKEGTVLAAQDHPFYPTGEARDGSETGGGAWGWGAGMGHNNATPC